MLDLSNPQGKSFFPTNTTNFSTDDPRQRRENFNNNANNNFTTRDTRPKRDYTNTNANPVNEDLNEGPPIFVGKVKCINEVEEKPKKEKEKPEVREVVENKNAKDSKQENIDIDRPVFINSNKNIDMNSEQPIEKNFGELVIQDVSI